MKLSNFSVINWLNAKGHFQGIVWTILAGIFSNLNDTSIKLVASNLPAMQITFFRLFFGMLIILPVLLLQGRNAFKIKNAKNHILRIIIGFGAIACWIFGASQTSLPSITTISFACPLFVLPLAYIFLGEKSDWRRILAVSMGFIGVIIIAFFEKGHVAEAAGVLSLHPGVLFLLGAALLFALSDILNKKMVATESLISLLFYFYFGTALIGVVPALLVWQTPGYLDLGYLLILGLGGVLILYCILKAAAATEISSIAPYKYVELVFSIFVGYFLFQEIIKVSTVTGAALIIPSALLIAYYEINKERKLRAKRQGEGVFEAEVA